MRARCEVCREFRPDSETGAGRLRELAFGRRRVLLCPLHARVVEIVRVTTFEGLRKLFRESRGQRSFVPRRAPSGPDERASVGRRATDARDG